MRQTAKQAKVYQAPTVKVVQFAVERGFDGTVDTVIGTPKNTLGQYDDVSNTDNSWNSSFQTGGTDDNHF